MYNVNFEIASSVFLLILFVYLKLQYSAKSEINRVFQHLVIITFVTGVLDVVTALLINNANVVPNSLNLWLNTLYLACDAVMGYQFCRYFSFAAHKKTNATILAKDGWVLIVLHVALLVANAFTGFIFYFNEAHEYCRGPVYILVYTIPQLLIFSGVLVTFFNFKRFSVTQKISLVVFVFIGFSGSVLQLLILPNYTIALFTTSMAIFMLMFAMETPDYVKLMKTMEELAATTGRLEKANRAKSDFLANMSHELRTPINSILGYNELIIKESVENHVAEYALNVQAGARTLLSQVNNVFDYTDIERGKLQLYPSKYYTSSLLQDLVLYSKFNAERKSLNFKIQVDEKLPHRMVGDVARIMQVVTNVLSNSFKFTTRGFVSLKVSWIPLGTTLGKIVFLITDSGRGIKQDLQNILGTDSQISGLGLPLVVKLLSMMNSSLKIDSENGKGTRVSFEIVQEVADAEPLGVMNFESREAILGHIDEDSFTAPNAKFLVVDDNEMNIKLFCGLLKDTKISFESANNGVDALEKISRNTYDMIFLDHMMPEKDGIEVLHEMKERKLNVNVPVIVLTANCVAGAREYYLSEGFDGYLAKPVNLGEIRSCIREYLRPDLLVENLSKPHKADSSTDFTRFLPEQIDAELGISYCDGDKAFYLDILERFVEHQKVDYVDAAFRERNVEQYRLQMHSMKTEALSIGAVQLSSLAKALENAAKNVDWKFIESNHGLMLMQYQLLLNNLEKILSKKNLSKVRSVNSKPTVLIVDDDSTSLRVAEKLLSEKFDVKSAESTALMFEFLENHVPDIILLDVNMPGESGFDAFEKIQKSERTSKIPVVFLTADEDTQIEVECFNAGAMDFIKKPFVKDVVMQRISKILQLSSLQKNLQYEVEIRTHELLREQQNSEQLSGQVMTALAATIDAKDKYTNGHSTRVAKYAQMLCKALGMSEEDQKKIYSMGLLHDIGKIGVPDEIINKPSRLSDEEFSFIRRHPVIGGDILKSISSFPELGQGARYHHERFDGRGYPDGLKGSEIPELARIICVADAYDAMASTRSYRGVLPQSVIREEIEKCSGSQFDPVIAAKMLEFIDADKDYLLHE